MADVFVELLGGKDLVDNVEEGADLCDLGQDLLAVFLGDASAALIWELVIYFLSEIGELLFVDGEVGTEVEPSLYGVSKLLELI